MESTKRFLPVLLRLIVAFLFIISAIAKMYPSPYFAISTFEVKQLYPMGFTPEVAVFFSRILIGIELALGLLLLQSHFLKKLVIPGTILLLVVFIVHLTIQTLSGAGGNCGCFGELLPMTPVEAIIKNVIAVALLIWLSRLLPKGFDRKNFWVVTTITLASVLMVFMLAPIKASQYDTENPTTVTSNGAVDTDGPAPVQSAYSKYFAEVDNGKKIMAFFAPGCDHCMEAAKQLTELKAKDESFPEMYIIFMDEEPEKIPDFFKYAGAEYPYKVLDVVAFWNAIGNTKDTPGVSYLWNGNVIKEWEGINDNKFVPAELEEVYKQPYSGN